tara:strand:- start:356 stop:898 length:543 start_codon:yes stop_codon:yes gene_type:complete
MIKLKDILNEKFEMPDSEKRQLKTAIKSFNKKKKEFFGLNSSIVIMAKVLKKNKFPGTARELMNALTTLRKAVENVESQHMNEAFTGISDAGLGYSNKEAMKFSQDAVNKASKEIGKGQQKAVTIFTSDMKNKKYDNMDLARSIKTGNIRDASNSKREVLSRLYYDVRDRFNKYNRRKKN